MNTEKYYSAQELAGLPGMPTHARSVNRLGMKGRPRSTGKGWEYPESELPRATRDHLLLNDVSASTPPADFMAGISDWAQNQQLRLSAKEMQDPKVQAKLECAQRFHSTAAYQGRETVIAALAEKYGVSSATIRRWVTQVDSWKVDSKTKHISLGETVIDLPTTRAFDAEAVAFAIAYYANNLRRGKKCAYNKMLELAPEQGWKVGSYESFTRLVNKIPVKAWEWIRKGSTGFELSTAPKIIRSWLSVPVYDVLCGDQNLPDYITVDDQTGEIHSPELYLWMDCTSRSWTGVWPAFGHYNKYTVGYSLREACRLGMPGEVFTDWGKPEVSKYTGQLVRRLSGHIKTGGWDDYAARYSGRDQVEHHKAQVRTPWHKPVEGQFNVFKRDLLNAGIPGFRQRQQCDWENDVQQELLKRAVKQGKLMTTMQFWDEVLKVVEAHNAKAFKPSEVNYKVVPAQVLYEGLTQQHRPIYDDTTLDLMFLPSVDRLVRQSMVTVTLAQGDPRKFYAPELSKIGAREKVRVSVDPYDPARHAVISTLAGDFICLAEPWAVQDPSDRNGLQDKIRRQAQLMKWWRGQVRRVKTGFDLPRDIKVHLADDNTRLARKAKMQENQQQQIKPADKRADDKIISMMTAR